MKRNLCYYFKDLQVPLSIASGEDPMCQGSHPSPARLNNRFLKGQVPARVLGPTVPLHPSEEREWIRMGPKKGHPRRQPEG